MSRTWRLVAWIRARRRPSFEFVGYSWPAHDRSRGWDTEDVPRRQREAWSQFAQSLEGAHVLGTSAEGEGGMSPSLAAQSAHLALAYAVARAGRSKNAIRVLDWGGGLGQSRLVIQALHPDISVEHHVAETPVTCVHGRQVNPESVFHDDDQWQSLGFDLVIASGSIQYVEHWRELLENLVTVSGDWTYVARFPVIESGRTYVMRQRANPLYDTEYLGWVVRRNEVLEQLEDLGSEPVREFSYGEAVHVPKAPNQPVYRGWLTRKVRP